MKLLSLEGKGLLISVGITIIMCGAVTYYCHMRVKNVEVALMKQNQVLTSFITNVQNEIRKGGLSDNKQVDVSSPEARNAVKNLENKKIEVSDDSASESDDSETEDETDASETDASETDDSASETEADPSEADPSEADHNKIKVLNFIKEDLKFIDAHDNFNTNSKIIELTDLEEITDFAMIHNETDDDSDDESISDVESVSDTNNKLEFKKIILTDSIVDNNQEPAVNILNLEEINVDSNNVDSNNVHEESTDFIKKIVKTEDKEKEKEKISNINKMKIDDLREKVILSGLGTVDSVKKLKKSDLITLLTNKN